MAVMHLTKENFESTVKDNKTVLVDFWAPWCGPCKMLGPIVEEIAGEVTDAVIAKINVDEQPELAQQFAVMSIPTVIVFKDGAAAEKSVGLVPKEQLLNLLK